MAIQHGLSRCYDLTEWDIDAVVATLPGAYALGIAQDQNVLTIRYVGRADDNVNARLKRWVGRYRHFQFAVLTTRAAFDKECWLYHTFSPVDNMIHPARPSGTNYRCPVVGCTAFLF
jgi:hypothetical protein